MGLLMGLVGPAVLRQFQTSKVKTAEIQLAQLSSAMDIFLLDTGRYPQQSEGLEVLVSDNGSIPGWSGPYLKGRNVPLDPWGNPYRLSVDATGMVMLESFGADGVAGGEGDARDLRS